MRNRQLLIATAVFFTVLSRAGLAIENPIGPSTVPPSSISSGLVPSPNPVSPGGNLVVTGNVRGGRHFRGVVPYRSVYDFGAPLSPSPLDSFLRSSTGSGDFRRYTGRYGSELYYPRYSRSGAEAVGSRVSGSVSTRIEGRAMGEAALPSLPRNKVLSGRGTKLFGSAFRPVSMSPQQMENMISSEVSRYSQGRRLTAEQRQSRLSESSLATERKMSSEQLLKQADDIKQSLISQGDYSQLSAAKKPGDGITQQFEARRQDEKLSKDREFDAYEQTRPPAEPQVGDLQKTLEKLLAARQSKESADSKKQMSEQESSERKEASEDELSAVGAKAILGSDEAFASFSNDKLNQYIGAAEIYLRQGRYYRAADAYTLALVYKPTEPLLYAGKSHALFAAGEYMSSALFLSRALEISPEYAQLKIDIETLVGGRDKLESRIADIEQCLERNNAAELQFLLSYVYYQIGRPGQAKEAIDKAYEMMPDSPAVVALKEAVNGVVKQP